MSNDDFRIDGTTKFKLANGNQASGKYVFSDSSGKLDWASASFGYDGFRYVSNVIASGQGSTIINLSANTHHMIVNNQGSTDYNTNKVRLVLPTSASNFNKIRITLMSQPWEVYVGSTASYILYSSDNNTDYATPKTKGPASISTFTVGQWFSLENHWTIEFTRFYYVNVGPFGANLGTSNYWIVTNCNGLNANVG